MLNIYWITIYWLTKQIETLFFNLKRYETIRCELFSILFLNSLGSFLSENAAIELALKKVNFNQSNSRCIHIQSYVKEYCDKDICH